jgi:hypothetical protein
MAPRGKQPAAEFIQSSDEDEQEIPRNEPKPNAQFTALEAELRAFKTAQETRADNLESMIRQLLARNPSQSSTNTPMTFNPDAPLPSTEHPTRSSKRLPDPMPLSDGVQPVFETWRTQVKNKLRANADHYPTEDDRMFFVFNRTVGDAQTHLSPRYDEDSALRYTSANEMIQHLATIYVNPNKTRDARYAYNRLMMKNNQTFAEFQTTFLQLAGAGQVPTENLQTDLFDKLTIPLQEQVNGFLVDMKTYQQLANRCLAIDTESRRINARKSRQKRLPESTTVPPAKPSFFTPGGARANTPAEPLPRQTTPIVPDKPVTCFNCKEPGHWASACPTTPRKLTVADIEEQPEAQDESGKEEA